MVNEAFYLNVYMVSLKFFRTGTTCSSVRSGTFLLEFCKRGARMNLSYQFQPNYHRPQISHIIKNIRHFSAESASIDHAMLIY